MSLLVSDSLALLSVEVDVYQQDRIAFGWWRREQEQNLADLDGSNFGQGRCVASPKIPIEMSAAGNSPARTSTCDPIRGRLGFRRKKGGWLYSNRRTGILASASLRFKPFEV